MDLKNKKMLSLNEIKEKGLSYSLSSDDFAKKGVKLIENSPEEINEVTQEMCKRLGSNFWDNYPETEELQKKFWQHFPYKKEFHGNVIKAKVGSEFLKKNKYLISE